MPALHQIVQCCDRLLRTGEIQDWNGAVNGLQLENDGRVTKIGAAVDSHEEVLKIAVREKIDLLIVHHGLFWQPIHPLTGRHKRKLDLALKNNLAVYSSHLPLDLHPSLGNNVLLAAALGLRKTHPFFFEKGQWIGRRGRLSLSRNDLAARLAKAVGRKPQVLPGGPATIRNIGIVSGGAGAELAKAAEEGIDTFITGEGPHWTFGLAHELGLNVFYGGHYATETFGVKALAAFLSKKFRVPFVFLDYPTGL
jgi:dinuclear metal center YbgI/SA1388 family protein